RPYDFDSDIDIALRDLADTAPDPRLVRADTPKAVAAVLLKALATSPRERFGSAAKFSTALERAYERGEAPPARQRALAGAAAPDDAQPAAVDHLPLRRMSRRATAVGAGVAGCSTSAAS